MCIGGRDLFACKSDGFCVLPMARGTTGIRSRRGEARRRTAYRVYVKPIRNKVPARETRFYFVGRMRFNISISPSRYVLAARLRS